MAPDDPELRLNYALALYYQDRHRLIQEIQNQLGEAYRLITPQTSHSLEPVINFDLTSHKFLEINVRFSGLNYFPRRSSVISRSE